MEYELVDIPKSEIDKIAPLWMKLNKIHENDSVFWKNRFSEMKFDTRIKPIRNIVEENLKITVIKYKNELFGYCLSSIHNDIGEIESIYIEEGLRKNNFGREMINNHIEWFKKKKCSKIVVSVSHGHDSVVKFYNKMGFYEKKIELEYKDSN